MEEIHPQDARFYNVGCNFYELAVSTGYDPSDARRLSEMVQFCVDQETGDELVPFWEALRDHAHIDGAFCKMLMDTGIMDRDEIFGIDNEVDEAIYDSQYPDDFDDDEEPEYVNMTQEEYDEIYGEND